MTSNKNVNGKGIISKIIAKRSNGVASLSSWAGMTVSNNKTLGINNNNSRRKRINPIGKRRVLPITKPIVSSWNSSKLSWFGI